jgi:hypothetical protein
LQQDQFSGCFGCDKRLWIRYKPLSNNPQYRESLQYKAARTNGGAHKRDFRFINLKYFSTIEYSPIITNRLPTARDLISALL